MGVANTTHMLHIRLTEEMYQILKQKVNKTKTSLQSFVLDAISSKIEPNNSIPNETTLASFAEYENNPEACLKFSSSKEMSDYFKKVLESENKNG